MRDILAGGSEIGNGKGEFGWSGNLRISGGLRVAGLTGRRAEMCRLVAWSPENGCVSAGSTRRASGWRSGDVSAQRGRQLEPDSWLTSDQGPRGSARGSPRPSASRFESRRPNCHGPVATVSITKPAQGQQSGKDPAKKKEKGRGAGTGWNPIERRKGSRSGSQPNTVFECGETTEILVGGLDTYVPRTGWSLVNSGGAYPRKLLNRGKGFDDTTCVLSKG